MSETKLHPPVVEALLSEQTGCSSPADPAAMQRAQAALNQFQSEAGCTDEDGLQWPSGEAIRTASDVLDQCSERDVAFDAVVSDGVGGISLERRQGDSLVRVLIDEQGDVQFLRFLGTKLIDHRRLEAPIP